MVLRNFIGFAFMECCWERLFVWVFSEVRRYLNLKRKKACVYGEGVGVWGVEVGVSVEDGGGFRGWGGLVEIGRRG